MKILTTILILISLSACQVNNKHLYNPNVSSEQAMRDRLACKQIGYGYVTANGFSDSVLSLVIAEDQVTQCLQELGYR